MIRVLVTGRNYRSVVGDIIRRSQTGAQVEDFLNEVGKVLVAYLRSYAQGERTPDGRPAHVGHWGDITFELMNGYGWTVKDGKLWLFNTSDHAVYVEARDGFFVLSGIGDSEAFTYAIRAGLRKVYPKARVKTGPARGDDRARRA